MTTKGSQPKSTDREYGRRQYVVGKETDHFHEIQRVTHKTEDDRNSQAHSEPIKPYMWDDYQEMEYWFSPWNMNFTWGVNVSPDYPTQVVYTTNPDAGPGFAWCFMGHFSGHDCTKSIGARAQVLTGGIAGWDYEVLQGDDSGITAVDNGTSGSFWDYEVFPPAGGWVPNDQPQGDRHIIRICMTDYAGAVCCEDVKVFCYPEEEEEVEPTCCETGPWLSFNDGATPDTIAPGGTITLYVSDGCPPYSWSTGNNGYSFGSASTTTTSNTLTSAAGTCGVHYDEYAEISVTDTCGSGVSFIIRNTGGQWNHQESFIGRCGAGCGGCGGCDADECGSAPVLIQIEGYQRWRMTGHECGQNTMWWCQGGSPVTDASILPPTGRYTPTFESATNCGAGCACHYDSCSRYEWGC